MVGGAVAHKRVADIQSMTWSFGEVDNTVITRLTTGFALFRSRYKEELSEWVFQTKQDHLT